MLTYRLLTGLTAALLLSTTLPAFAAPSFSRIGSLPVALNTPDAEETSAEIITATEDGMMLVYSDAPAGGIGFIDITDPKAPKAAGFLALDGSPTSVTIVGQKAYVAIDDTEDMTAPAGRLAVVDLAGKSIESTCDLGGQPDSIAHNDTDTLLAIAIENQRNEDLDDGRMPQLPAGTLVIAAVANGTIDCASLKVVDLTGLAETAGDDPEPEFVAFNSKDEIAVTLQENNHVIIVDGKTGTVVTHFSAGTVDLEGVDTSEDGALRFTGTMSGVPREPDAVKWLDDDRLVIANEGDYEGGSRSFTIFNRDGSVAFESGASMEMEAARLGHYPDGRDVKGVEPEGLEVAQFGDKQYIFVVQERSSLVAIYENSGDASTYLQSIPSGISPEGIVAIPERNLVATANEADLRGDGLGGAHVMIYELAEGQPTYPQLISDLDAEGLPIGWAAISGAVADAEKPGMLYAVSDSVLGAESAIYIIDATAKPARITAKTIVTRDGNPAQKLDLEGIALDGEGGFWLASEGRTDRLIPHALYHVNAEGEIENEVAFPADLLTSEIRFGAEGVARTGEGEDTTLWIAIQREWKDDPKGMVKLLSYKPATGAWAAVHYPLATATAGWVGLSEITISGDYAYIIERDNQTAGAAALKALYRVPLASLQGAEIGGELPMVEKELVRDLIPDLAAQNGYVLEKVESFAIDSAGEGFVITDNDGVDDSSGETFFFSIGKM